MPTSAASSLAGVAAAPLVLLAGSLPAGTAELLLEAGCRVQAAGSSAALQRLAGGLTPPRLILLAETVADEPGLSLLSRLQSAVSTRAIPVLYVASGDDELALALGAADCLNLPLRPLVLLARVRAQLRLTEAS